MCRQRDSLPRSSRRRGTDSPLLSPSPPQKRAPEAGRVRGAMDLLAHTTRPPGFMAPHIDSSSSCSEGEWQADQLPLPGSGFSPGNQHTPEDDVQAPSLTAELIDSDDPFVAHGGMRSIGGLSSYVSPSKRQSESPVSEAYTCSDSGGALSMDDHWEPGTASRPVALPTSRTSWPHAATWPSHTPLELSANSPAHVERGADASGAVYEEQTESLDAELVKAVAIERPAAAAATTIGTEVAVTAAAEDMAAAAEGGVAPALIQSSVISLCAVGDDTHLRAHLSRTRAQLHSAQLQLQRATGALATTREQLSESEVERRTLLLRAEGLHASGGGAGEAAAAAGGGGGGGGRSALVELAERRLAELEDELRRKDEQLQQLQACRPRPPPPAAAPGRRAARRPARHLAAS
jgi:hypothetical protein